MLINSDKLRAKIYEQHRSQAEFSRSIGWDANKICMILSGKRIPNVDECAKIASELKLSADEFISIFMPNLSPNGDNNAA